MKSVVNFSGFSAIMVMEFVCDNYNRLGGNQTWYTCTVALEHLFQTGRLDTFHHNLIKNMNGNKLFSMIVKMANCPKNAMFAYDQFHFETEWLIKINKLCDKSNY